MFDPLQNRSQLRMVAIHPDRVEDPGAVERRIRLNLLCACISVEDVKD